METTLKDLRQRYDLASAKASALRWRLETTKSEPACSEQAAKAQLLDREQRAWQGRIGQVLELLGKLTRRERGASRDAEAFLIETSGNQTPSIDADIPDAIPPDCMGFAPLPSLINPFELPLLGWPALIALHGTEAAEAIIGTNDRPRTRQMGRKRKQKVLRQGGQATRSGSDRIGYERVFEK